ncbi:MAG: winged helix DNA-binding protein [Anaerococcus prevotii]|nr:winged helix DNA-binding protein [Anaerococcus prevotii]
MDDNLVERLITSLYKIGHGGSSKKLNNSVRGENMALALISKNKGSTYPKDIEENMGISSARVAKIIKGLEEKKLVTRKPDRKDRRKTIVSLTDRGKRCEDLRKEKINFALTSMLELLGEDDGADFVRLIEKIEQAMPQIRKMCEEKFGDSSYDKDF